MDRRLFLKSSLAIAAMARFGFAKEPPVLNHETMAGNNQFAMELFAKLRKEEGNLFCSPFSVSTALAMTSVGARGNTAEEMSQVLHLQDKFSLRQNQKLLVSLSPLLEKPCCWLGRIRKILMHISIQRSLRQVA